jgi:hypothetical protein
MQPPYLEMAEGLSRRALAPGSAGLRAPGWTYPRRLCSMRIGEHFVATTALGLAAVRSTAFLFPPRLPSAHARLAVIKSSDVRSQDSRAIRSKRPQPSLPAEVARQFLHAQLHQRQRLRRHSSAGRRPDGNRLQRTHRPTQGRNGGLVSTEGLLTQGGTLVTGGELKTGSHCLESGFSCIQVLWQARENFRHSV